MVVTKERKPTIHRLFSGDEVTKHLYRRAKNGTSLRNDQCESKMEGIAPPAVWSAYRRGFDYILDLQVADK